MEFSLGSGNFGGVFNGGGANKVEDGLFKRSYFGGCGSDGEVGSLDTESQTIGDVVGGLDCKTTYFMLTIRISLLLN